MKRSLGRLWTITLIAAGVIVLLTASLSLAVRYLPYPEAEFFRSRRYSTRILDKDGRLVQILPLENGLRREYMPLEQMPEGLADAFITAEDKHFYSHSGVDLPAIARAAFQNITQGRTVSGASTITMQLARMISPETERTLAAKLKEAFNALRLEFMFSKEEILELYLNNLPFGFNTEGVASAARTFFGKEASELSEYEMCCLAVIPRRPALYSPLSNPEKCAEAVIETFGTDTSTGISSGISYDEILKTAQSACSFSYPFHMPHYIRYLTENYPEQFTGRTDVTLSASLQLQSYVEDILASSVRKYDTNRITNGAILVLDSQTGEILAWAGSTSFQDDANQGQIDGVTVPNQPGSSMKPFLYAMALDNGYLPSDILPDIQTDFGFTELYLPQNFNNRFNGPVRLRMALASSLNVPAVYLLNRLGIKNYTDRLLQMGFHSLEKADPGLGLALGNAEVSIFELTAAFSAFTRDGFYMAPSFNREDAIQRYSERKQVFSRDTSRIICSILSDSGSRSTGFGYTTLFETPFPAIFKTGTANQYQNITALAATPLYTVGVWMGNFTGETVMGKTGSSIPASIAKDILCAMQGNRSVPFAEPEQYTKQPVCALSGLTPGPYCPDVLMEYVPSGNSCINDSTCSWHTENGTVYPAEYQQWFLLKQRNGSVDGTTAELSCTSPKEGSIFYYDASSAGSLSQKLTLTFTGGTEDSLTITISSDKGTETLCIERPFSCSIPIERGTYHILAECGLEETYTYFTVR